MPLPVGHSLMGYMIFESLPQDKPVNSGKMLVLLVVVANLPDIDYFPGIILGNPNKYHHDFTHSLFFSLIIGAILGMWFFIKLRKRFLPYYFLIFTVVCFSHVLLDYFTADTREPYGVPLFWPMSNDFFISPVSVFMSVHKSDSSKLFFQSLFVTHNFWVALWEVAVFLPLLSIIKIWKSRRKFFPQNEQ